MGACATCWRRWVGAGATATTAAGLGEAHVALIALGPYRGGLGRLVRAAKYRPDHALLDALGRALGERLARRLAGDPGTWQVVPAPPDPGRRRRRGGDHAALLARAVVAACGPRTRLRPVLRRLRAAPSQAGSSLAERARNLDGAIGTVPDAGLGGASVVLVDDVFTTGATARACADALRAGGARRILVAVVARSH